ncbi:MAG TPA: MarC family protein [Terracidiphilus sp.]|jgi:multiple antibiotic resistance protein
MAAWTAFLLAFSALLPIINPLGSALVFLGLVGKAPPPLYRSLARRIAVNNILFLGAIEVLGSAILNFFGISLPIVEVAGGIVISAIAWGVLNENDSSASVRQKQEESEELDDSRFLDLNEKLFYPFTFPITSGPGTLVTMLTLSAHISRNTLSSNLLGHSGIFGAVVIVSLLVYACYAYAPIITTKVSRSTAHGILRVIAFIMLCIGVQIAWNGLDALLKTLF